MISITEIFKNGQESKKIQIEDEISSKHNAIVGFGHRQDGHIGIVVMDRPLKSPNTIAFINTSVNSMKSQKAQDLSR